ncbi:mechanosensitive ion channel protein MscL [Luteibacter rhizovicinus DSM 16549]|uniref:Large-conductance mechanosensitive channel n=1 Tax=Luteibacter rhizovicinus DSM 16549 TaxID=1440763 RepID=A0A0G9HGY4_9GAMM|nr:large-conductance mechanosensitive channel protein MscL [Luteibacter rhizovicinus]APG03215.1 mechanosensitive ion channel protein MscL [Luteibacter rhizovicinus DSM 16549]KLD66907.1 mechanosensitive ion channel protein MscL [Luteibacter rhizovicinus DSM 16549]KLD75226.1 mechanosensitive ion channel protein MscL [Xanthomonas hyacinthi DSM 19077]
MSFVAEFKKFALRGNVVDLAVGVVIGAAFGKIVTSLVDNIIMPPIGWLIGGIDFSDWKWVLKPADAVAKKAEVAIQYGIFINVLIQFVIVAIAIFIVVKAINRLTRREEEAPAAPAADVVLLTEIRDLLRSQQGR